LNRLDPEPFRSIATAIDVARKVNESGAFQTQLVNAALLGQEKYGVESDEAGSLCLPVTAKEFAHEYVARFGGVVNLDFLRESAGINWAGTSRRTKRGAKNSDNSS